MKRYLIWCKAHVDLMGDRASARYETTNKREAARLVKQADSECQADPPSLHYITEASA